MPMSCATHEPRALQRVGCAAVVGYLLGTFPSADMASRAASGGGVDLRLAGSGNPGAMNAFGQLGSGWGAAVLVADVAKGSVAAWAGGRIGGDDGAYAAGTAAIAGHIFPLWSSFRGGKGVATSAGASLFLFPAYFPLDAGVAALAALRSANADRAIEVSSLLWAVASVLWWRARWPNAWGPPPNRGLPLFALLSALMMITRVELARRSHR
jgi:glycerol-3-phosphate acyltransferase PlsY